MNKWTVKNVWHLDNFPNTPAWTNRTVEEEMCLWFGQRVFRCWSQTWLTGEEGEQVMEAKIKQCEIALSLTNMSDQMSD